MNRVLITGGAGFIGSNLVEFINAKSPETDVVVMDDLSSGYHDNLDGLTCDFREASILDYRSLVEAARRVDSIIHLAAIGSVPRSVAHPRPTHSANITGTLNVLEAAREAGAGHVVVASSSSVYGANLALRKSEFDWTRPLSPYAVTKLATESYSLAYQSSYGLRTFAFRFFNVYGPRQRADHDYAAVIPRFIQAALNGLPLTVYGDGTQSRDFTYVETVCEALFEVSRNKVQAEHPVNLAFGRSTTIRDLIQKISSTLGQPLSIEFKPKRVGDVVSSQADPGRLLSLLPSLRSTDLQDGIERTIRWFIDSDRN